MNDFIYYAPVKIFFGNYLSRLGKEAAAYGKRVLLVSGRGSVRKTGLYERILDECKGAGLEVTELSGVKANPEIDLVREGAKICRDEGIDLVIGAGGGSVMDTAKWIAAAVFADFDPWRFFSRAKRVEKALPVITIPTTASTGSETNASGVMSNAETKDKLGRSAPAILPKAAFLDPENTFSVGAFQTACGAADMLSHILEVYFSREPGLYMLDTMMEGMMKTIVRFAPAAIAQPKDYEARANLMWTAGWAINGLVGEGRNHAWSCHPIEHELSALYDMTHGLGLAVLTPKWMRYILSEDTAERFRQYGCRVFGLPEELPVMDAARQSIRMTENFLYRQLGLPAHFSKNDIPEEDIPLIAKKAVWTGNLKNAYQPLSEEDAAAIVRMCIQEEKG